MAAPLACSYCSSTDSVDSSAFAPTCALCASVPSLCEAGVALFWHIPSRQYFAVGGARSRLLRPGADAGRIRRLGALPSCPAVTIDFHGVADSLPADDLKAALGPTPCHAALLLSYVKPCGEVRLRAQAALEALAAATGLDAWLSFVKPPVAEPLCPGSKGHFMAVVGSRVLVDDHAEHTGSAVARGLAGLRVRSGDRGDICAALAAALAGPAACAAWRQDPSGAGTAAGGGVRGRASQARHRAETRGSHASKR